MSFSCTDEQFSDTKVQNLISDQWKEELIQSAKESGFEDVKVEWKIEELN